MKKYLPAFLLFSLLIAGIIAYLNLQAVSEVQLLRWMIFAYFSIITLLFHFGITKATESRPQVFVRYYMGSTTLKLLLNLGIIVVYAMLHKALAVNFIITFMIFYFLYTIFEVVFVWKAVKPNPKS